MTVVRIVSNVATSNVANANAFYGHVLGMGMVMDLGWIVTFASPSAADQQISFATEGGSGAPVPDITIEVDDFDVVFERVRASGLAITYGPSEEDWGIRRFFVRDPFGRLVNVLEHV